MGRFLNKIQFERSSTEIGRLTVVISLRCLMCPRPRLSLHDVSGIRIDNPPGTIEMKLFRDHVANRMS